MYKRFTYIVVPLNAPTNYICTVVSNIHFRAKDITTHHTTRFLVQVRSASCDITCGTCSAMQAAACSDDMHAAADSSDVQAAACSEDMQAAADSSDMQAAAGDSSDVQAAAGSSDMQAAAAPPPAAPVAAPPAAPPPAAPLAAPPAAAPGATSMAGIWTMLFNGSYLPGPSWMLDGVCRQSAHELSFFRS